MRSQPESAWVKTINFLLWTPNYWILTFDTWHYKILVKNSRNFTFDSWLLTLNTWLLTLDPWILTLDHCYWLWTLDTKNITLDSWLLTFEYSLNIYFQPGINEIQKVPLIRFSKISRWIWFKEVQFVQTPRFFFNELGCVWEKGSQGLFGFWLKTSVRYLCVWLKVCQRHMKLNCYAGVLNTKPANNHPIIIFAFSDGI